MPAIQSNPTRQSPMETAEQASNFPCPQCGGKMTFDPTAQRLRCTYCENTLDVKTVMEAPQEYDLDAAPRPEQENWGAQVRTVKCAACGATTVLDLQATATICAFCGASQVLENQEGAGIAPESLVPFRITEAESKAAFRKWIRRRWFAPRKAKLNAALGRIAGVYLPFWAYDAEASAYYIGEAGDHYYVMVTRTVTRDGKQVQEQVQEQRTRWRATSGMVYRSFDDEWVPASKRLDTHLLEDLHPYDMEQLVTFQPAFLAGFSSEKPAVSVDEGWDVAQQSMKRTLEEDARQDILSHADEARVQQLHANYQAVKYKLSLLPAWLSSFAFKGKQYHVAVNGQTGRVSGKTPISALRVAGVVAVVAALIALVAYFIMR